jgi:hypothetical protein
MISVLSDEGWLACSWRSLSWQRRASVWTYNQTARSLSQWVGSTSRSLAIMRP